MKASLKTEMLFSFYLGEKRMKKREKKQNGRVVVYSECTSQQVTDALDFLLDFRDTYLWATIFKGCKWGYILGEEHDPQKEKNDGKKNTKHSFLYRFLKNITWEVILLVEIWLWISMHNLEDTYVYMGIGVPLFFGVLAVAFFGAGYYDSLKKEKKTLIFPEKGQGMLFLGAGESGNKYIRNRFKQDILNKSKWHAVLWILAIWVLVMWSVLMVKYGYGSERFFWEYLTGILFQNVLYSLAVLWTCYTAYKVFLGEVYVSVFDKTGQDIALWEDRADHMKHLWTKVTLYGLISRSMLVHNMKKKNPFSWTEYYYNGFIRYESGYQLLESACYLSWLRCLCLLSEEMKQFTDQYDEKHIKVEIREDKDCNDEKGTGMYTIVLTGENIGNQDTVVPMEAETRTRSYTLPYLIGQQLMREFRNTKCLDLSVMDWRYRSVGKSFNKYKEIMMHDLKSVWKCNENSKVIQYLNRKDDFTEM